MLSLNERRTTFDEKVQMYLPVKSHAWAILSLHADNIIATRATNHVATHTAFLLNNLLKGIAMKFTSK